MRSTGDVSVAFNPLIFIVLKTSLVLVLCRLHESPLSLKASKPLASRVFEQHEAVALNNEAQETAQRRMKRVKQPYSSTQHYGELASSYRGLLALGLAPCRSGLDPRPKREKKWTAQGRPRETCLRKGPTEAGEQRSGLLLDDWALGPPRVMRFRWAISRDFGSELLVRGLESKRSVGIALAVVELRILHLNCLVNCRLKLASSRDYDLLSITSCSLPGQAP